MEYSSACQKLLNESHGCVCYWTETIMLSDAFIQRVNEYPEWFFFSPVTIWTVFFELSARAIPGNRHTFHPSNKCGSKMKCLMRRIFSGTVKGPWAGGHLEVSLIASLAAQHGAERTAWAALGFPIEHKEAAG